MVIWSSIMLPVITSIIFIKFIWRSGMRSVMTMSSLSVSFVALVTGVTGTVSSFTAPRSVLAAFCNDTIQFCIVYRTSPKYSDTRNGCNYPQVWTIWLYYRLIHLKDADGMANSVGSTRSWSDSPLGVVWSGSALFAQAYLSEYLRSLRYTKPQKKLYTWYLTQLWELGCEIVCFIICRKNGHLHLAWNATFWNFWTDNLSQGQMRH